MKFVTFLQDEQQRFGGITSSHESKIVDLTANFSDLHSVLKSDRLDAAKTAVESGKGTINLADVTLLPPITTAEKYFCIGVNYANRNAEYKDGSEAPKNPSVFMRSRESFVGHGQYIERPPESHQLDYEGEIVVIIGKEGRRIKRENARDHIAGLCVMNEGTLRDWVRHAKFNVTQGKNFEKSGALGPWMVPLTDDIDLKDLQIQTRVNGELRQDDHTSNMMFPIEFQIEYLSKFARLKAGDVIATGTPNGAGARFDPPKYLVPGDVVEVTCPGIGTLRNEVRDEVV
ncbi:2-hydroxyhepta-2,4-diene-1,7-dioate isomerase [Litorimonas cladophorae]|uniref:2-hydroxyhepta-2,4-diene-1,7-dioate isomerase n=1 Tax=Litorimonas cladophorae TaxID=1220491 RepID=A0A918NER2_9PROT|nr:fumarylacetoacetate hydrolase family protein [Litorimonas cladophorae]GGX61977.1 2-hydroxyhepta-2,4-diene-1,7-dioate isomerase [Litorimonas cladophorae]